MATIVPVKRKKGTGFQAVIRKKGHKPIKRTFDTKGAAKAWAAEQEGLIYAKKYKDPRLAGRVSLSQALEKYANYAPLVEAKKESTLDREKYSRAHLERVLDPDSPLSDITTAVVASYQVTRMNEGASASSIRQELAMLSRMFRKAKTEWGLPVENPTEGVERISPPPGRERFLTEEEAILVLEETKNSRNERFYPYMLLLMHSGMRSGEAARLHTSKVDLENCTIQINKTKTGKPRTIALTTRAAEALRDITPLEDGYYFLKPNHRASKSTMLRPGCVFRECWKRMWERLDFKAANQADFPKIPYFKIHDIRHTAASHLLEAGVDIRIIADILGHATLQMVMRYTHVFDKTKNETMNNLNHLGFEGK